ncbi:hypothetical protein HCA58_08695 [Micromonospora sp. HNM0581]|uniref:hypothetical protein n=1 Tax=Micromonospora sp. HNM0581 TaxID=2716341 RepID=UPI00146B19EE|nr:hypothetical protein [Micromonospora sp. HNM0581]NLU78456.1 hypothetical protein [Micromonospora sp. HNM0581]
MRSPAAHVAKIAVAGVVGIGLTLIGASAVHADSAPTTDETVTLSTTLDNWPWT